MKRENMENALTAVKDVYLLEAAECGERKKRIRMGKKWMILPVAAVLAASLMMAVNAIVPVDLRAYLQRTFGEHFAMLEGITVMPEDVEYSSSGEALAMELKDCRRTNTIYSSVWSLPAERAATAVPTVL